MKLGRFRLALRYPPRPQALLLFIDSRKSDYMWQVCDGVRVEAYDLTQRVIIVRPRYLFWLVRYAVKMSKIAAMLGARISSQGIGVVLASENHDVATVKRRVVSGLATNQSLFHEITSAIPEVELISVQHGQELRRLAPRSQVKRCTLLCWGGWTADNFRTFGRMEEKFVPVGPLIDGLYRQIRPTIFEKDIPICLVSTVKGRQWWAETPGERQLGYEQLVRQLLRYSREFDLAVHVALTIDRDQFGASDADYEREWFLKRLGPNIRFTEPKLLSGDRNIRLDGRTEPRYVRERYATYVLCDRSEITIGMSSSALWESFGRGNKVLAVNHTDNPVYDFPIGGIWSARKPTYEDFSRSLTALFRMSESEWKEASESARSYLITYDPLEPPNRKINSLLRSAVNQSEMRQPARHGMRLMPLMKLLRR